MTGTQAVARESKQSLAMTLDHAAMLISLRKPASDHPGFTSMNVVYQILLGKRQDVGWSQGAKIQPCGKYQLATYSKAKCAGEIIRIFKNNFIGIKVKIGVSIKRMFVTQVSQTLDSSLDADK